MSGGTERFIIEVDGKDLKSLTGKVRGRVQDHVKNMHRYHEATFMVNRTEGFIDAIGVPRDALEQALNSVQGELSPKNRFTYTIEAGPTEEAEETPPQIASPEELDRNFTMWTEQAQKKWDGEREAYQREISRLSTECKRLTSDIQALTQLSKRGEEIADALKKDKAQLMALYENASTQLTQSPEEAARVWVGDWSRLANRIEESVSGAGLGEEDVGISKLADFTLTDLHSEIMKILPRGVELGRDIASIEAFASVGSFEETDEYRQSHETYLKAKQELEYLKGVQDGSITVPDSIKDMLTKNVDVGKDESAIRSFDALMEAHSHRAETAGEIGKLLTRYKAAEVLRDIKPTMRKERPLPIVVFSDQADGHWYLEALFPSTKGIVCESCMSCLEKAAAETGLRNKDVKVADNMTRVRYVLPNSVRDWKDASKKQEVFTWGLASQFKTCPLHTLGVKIRITKMMDLGPQAERVEIDLPSKFGEDKAPADPEVSTSSAIPPRMIHGPATGPDIEPSHDK